jgi:hypothetical protein
MMMMMKRRRRRKSRRRRKLHKVHSAKHKGKTRGTASCALRQKS